MFWIIVIILLVLFIMFGINSQNKEKDIKEKYRRNGFDLNELIFVGTYVGGHPDKNDNIDYCHVYKKNSELIFYRKFIAEDPIELFSIQIDLIKNIIVEDATTIESRITVGRLFFVGIFALAWKKKKKEELAFIIVEWNDGKFDHSTTFSTEGKDSMQKANGIRNHLIKLCR